MTERAITAVVSGRVQGVFFRASTRRVALGEGPPDAHVVDVEVADAEVVPRLVGFDVRR